MSEQVEKNSGGSFWPIFVFVIIMHVLRRVLSIWLDMPFAQGLGAWLAALVCYRWLAEGKVAFGRWAVGSLILIAGFISIAYGLSRLLCPRLGAAATWGVVGLATVLFVWAAVKLGRMREAGGKAWQWLLLGVGAAAAGAFVAWLNPEGFCR